MKYILVKATCSLINNLGKGVTLVQGSEVASNLFPKNNMFNQLIANGSLVYIEKEEEKPSQVEIKEEIKKEEKPTKPKNVKK